MRILLFICSLVFCQGLLAQTTIKGTVLDLSEQPVPYATVAVYNPSDSSLVGGATTNTEGKFRVEVPAGTYYVKISFLSYQSKFIPEVKVGEQPVQLGQLTLQPTSKSLEEVVVKEKRNQFQLKLDKKVFNVEEDLSLKGGNAADILDRVPSVSVDVEGNISLRGSGNVRIFINGKPSGLVSSGDPQSLRQLQGNMIKRIEVITNPSAKYDAEGEVGIINIVLKEQDKSGLNGSFDVNTGYPHDHGAAANLNYRKNWINFFISEGISWDRDPGGGESTQEYFFPDTTYSYERIREQTRGDFNNNLRLGVDLYLTPKDIITVAGIYQYSTGKNLSTTTYKDFNDQGEHVQTVERFQDEKEVSHEVEAELSYEKKFAQKDRKWTIDAKYNLEDDREDATYEEDVLANGVDIDDLQRSDNLEYEEAGLFQTDYVHPFGREGKFETGLKANLRHFINDYTVEDQVSEGVWEPIARYDNEFIYDENIYAAYAMAGEKFGSFSLKGGLRAEYSQIKTELIKTNEVNPRDYLDLFPSIFVGYELNKKHTFQASYGRRISRPDFWDLVPFFQYADSRNYRSGNPDLDPEYTHSFELGYQRYLQSGNLLGTVYYRYRTGVIEDITYVESSGLTRHKPINFATEHDYGIEYAMNYDLKKWWQINGNINGYRAITEGTYQGDTLFSDTYTAHVQMSTKITIAELVDVQLSGRYRAPRKTTQGYRKSSYAIDIGASMDILNEKGTITLNVQDIFDTRRRRWVTEGEYFRTEGYFQWHTSRQVRLSFNYRLNRDKEPESPPSE